MFQFNTIQSGQGAGNEFVYIIAAVVGGCLLTGGCGSAVGAGIGALIFGMVNQGIVTIHDLDTARWMIGEIVEVTAYDALAAFDLARAADESWRCGRTVVVEPQRTGTDVIYTVKQESR